MDLLQREAIRSADSMTLFERDGVIHFGAWRKWYAVRYNKSEADRLLKEFCESKPSGLNQRA